jgi:hypothetical protein
VDVVDLLHLRIDLARLSSKLSCRPSGRIAELDERRLELAERFERRLRRGNSSWSSATVPVEILHRDDALLERPSRGALRALLAREREAVDVVAVKPSIVAIRSAEMPCGTSGYISRR